MAESAQGARRELLSQTVGPVIRHDKNRKCAAKQEERLGDVSEVNGPGPGRLERMKGRSIKIGRLIEYWRPGWHAGVDT